MSNIFSRLQRGLGFWRFEELSDISPVQGLLVMLGDAWRCWIFEDQKWGSDAWGSDGGIFAYFEEVN